MKLRLFAAAAVASLAYASLAVAGPGPASTAQVSATFFANTVVSANVAAGHNGTCSGSGDVYTITHTTFTGTAASSDPRFAGPVTVDVTSIYDTTKNLGWLRGSLTISAGGTPPTSGHLHARLVAVNVNGAVQGSIVGDAGAGAHLLGGFSGTFSATGGFGSSSAPVSIGAGSGTNAALVASGSCSHDAHPDQPRHPDVQKPHGPSNSDHRHEHHAPRH
jgi:hypothetical protein